MTRLRDARLSRRRLCRRLAAGTPLLLAAGCASLLPQPGQPPQLYLLRSRVKFPPDLPRVSQQLLVALPVASAGLDTERIALSRSAVTLDYFANAAWTDHAPALVQSLLVRSFEATGKIVGVARDSASLRPDYLLLSELERFEAVYSDSEAAPKVEAALVLRLARMPDRVIIGERRAERSAAAGANSMAPIVAAFGEALDGALEELVAWTLRRISADAASGARRGAAP